MTAAVQRVRSPRKGRLAIGVAAVTLASAAFAASAQAFHIPGATYAGTHSGGGSVSLNVSPDGSAVTRFAATAIPAPVGQCDVTTTGSIPIIDHRFSAGGFFSFSGSFPGVQSAQGTFSLSGPPCGSAGPFSWTAATPASPSGSEECQDARQDLRRAKKKVKKAKKALRQADTEAEERKAKKKLRKAKKKKRRAKRDVERFC